MGLFFKLLDTLTFDQDMLFFSEFFNVFSLAWYSTLIILPHQLLAMSACTVTVYCFDNSSHILYDLINYFLNIIKNNQSLLIARYFIQLHVV